MGYKKKLYQLNPDDKPEPVLIQHTKRIIKTASVTMKENERYVREILNNKLSGTHMGIWLLIPEHLRLGTWDLLQGTFNKSGLNDLHCRMAMQMVAESALCVNRIRKKDSLCNQGFSISNGLSVLVTDEKIHEILNSSSIADFERLQATLLKLRQMENHFDESHVFALDPHRIESATKRRMPAKRKRPDSGSRKMLQTFFCVDTFTGQPLAFTLGSSGKNCTPATIRLMNLIESAGINQGLFVADKEHVTKELLRYFNSHQGFDILVPAPEIKKIKTKMSTVSYHQKWAGFAIGESSFRFENDRNEYKLIVQREGEIQSEYTYKAFLTTSSEDALDLLSTSYPKRWTIEEFFNFEGDMGWNRASTFNLNIKYGKQSLALLAQAATHGLKKNLPGAYRSWTAGHLASQVLTNMEGDVKVKDDKIIVTYYRDHEALNLKSRYENISEKLEREGVNHRIPWLFDFKLDFRFK